MKRMRFIYFTVVLLWVNFALAQKSIDWTTVDFADEYKIKAKISGSASKSLTSDPTFVNDYFLTQATLMKGSSQAGTLQKQDVGSVFAEASLGGVSKEAIQEMVDELYVEFVEELKAIGLTITDGDELINSEFAQDKNDKDKNLIGKTGNEPLFDKVSVMEGSDIKEQMIFRPEDKNIYATSKTVYGNFYMKPSMKLGINMISIGYVVRFAAFDDKKKGLSKNTLTTTAALSIQPVIMIYNSKGAASWISVEKQIWGNNDWSEGLVETASRDGSYMGLSSSAEYAIGAMEDKYIAELKSILSNLQKDIVGVLKENL
jgi:hypothetical protein